MKRIRNQVIQPYKATIASAIMRGRLRQRRLAPRFLYDTRRMEPVRTLQPAPERKPAGKGDAALTWVSGWLSPQVNKVKRVRGGAPRVGYEGGRRGRSEGRRLWAKRTPAGVIRLRGCYQIQAGGRPFSCKIPSSSMAAALWVSEASYPKQAVARQWQTSV